MTSRVRSPGHLHLCSSSCGDSHASEAGGAAPYAGAARPPAWSAAASPEVRGGEAASFLVMVSGLRSSSARIRRAECRRSGAATAVLFHGPCRLISSVLYSPITVPPGRCRNCPLWTRRRSPPRPVQPPGVLDGQVLAAAVTVMNHPGDVPARPVAAPRLPSPARPGPGWRACARPPSTRGCTARTRR